MAETTQQDKTAKQLRLLEQALDSGRLGPVKRLVNTLSAAEIGNLLESLPSAKRQVVWGLVDAEDDGEVLVHVGEDVREDLLRAMDTDEIVAAAESLDIDDLADLFEDLPDTVVDEVLKSMDRENRERLEQMLTYDEDTAGRLMNPDVVTVRADVTVDVVLRYLRLRGELPEATDHLYVVSRRRQYQGRLSLAQLLTADPAVAVNRIMDADQPAIDAETEVAEVAQRFANYDWLSAPVVDENNVLLGHITIDDVVDIIRDQAEHQALGAAGLDEEEDLFAPVPRTTKRRAVWLGINLLTAFLASWVIGNFENVLKQVVACAVLMPIVASMGGVAGTQVQTLMIRAMALGQVSASNAMHLLRKEMLVALANGILWALTVGGVALLIYRDAWLALAFGAAMVLNLLAAAFTGVFLPLALRRVGIDPALAGGVLLTTVTDCCGFATFLGLSTVLLVR
ncbi:Mg2+ transporter MgtE [Tahibacter aquaticus]|uniref:Magnesium transporter MgtE n=1 Tax=Tahibacter aquaticus TaxID=520092 RepID=A0A4R6YWD1_9GAMM|nr:magnesium transporter [Tahibacter aquaticus]TDR43123.1 Mg2+ transporter MgtE [Tahibacter aquaticus]